MEQAEARGLVEVYPDGRRLQARLLVAALPAHHVRRLRVELLREYPPAARDDRCP